jgi:hypothetical protein
MPLYQGGPNRWTNRPPERAAARSSLPMPMVISDTMPPTEQVDGKFYTSKAAFRAVGRAHGLTEVGNEKPKPKTRVNDREGRRRSIKKAIEKYAAGHRVEAGRLQR